MLITSLYVHKWKFISHKLRPSSSSHVQLCELVNFVNKIICTTGNLAILKATVRRCFSCNIPRSVTLLKSNSRHLFLIKNIIWGGFSVEAIPTCFYCLTCRKIEVSKTSLHRFRQVTVHYFKMSILMICNWTGGKRIKNILSKQFPVVCKCSSK